ncbi:MAG TPA: phosphoribosyltransferase [Dermatophilaceae bacterium]|nr:phosphoribosyltransferase [Dermatophilaceae bacterium]HPZ67421.1 phosphoribosyltransferase [Dermatophilaceae bacterium]
MSYRTFTKPDSTNWTTRDWLNWAMGERLLLDVRTDIPEGVCASCYGGTDKTYEDTTFVRDPSGFMTPRTELRRWPKCYRCNTFDGLDGILPISYSLHDRLESAIWRAKNDAAHRWLSVPLASILHAFLGHHLECIERRWGPVHVITIVPSHPSARGGWDHVRDLIGRVRTWPGAGRWDLDLLEKVGRSAADTRRDRPRGDLFRVRDDRGAIEGQRVLLLDDTYTTGGTLRSAGLAVRAAGGRPVGLTIGRQVRNNEYGAHIVADAVARDPLFDPSRCAIH